MLPKIVPLILLLLSLPFAAFSSCLQPSLVQQPTLATGQSPMGLALADFDKDGNLDLLSPEGSSPSRFHLRFGNGDGTFDAPVILPAAGHITMNVHAPDLNNDGWPDLLASNGTTGEISVRLNQKNGTFGDLLISEVPGFPLPVVVADANGDGNLDLGLVIGAHPQFVVVYGDGAGRFSGEFAPWNSGYQPHDSAFGDLDGNGDTDIILYGQPAPMPGQPVYPSFLVIYYKFGGGYQQIPPTYVNLPANTRGRVIVHDVEGDGDLDIVTANGSGRNISVLVNNSNQFTRTDYATDDDANIPLMVDVTEDGILDIVVAPSPGLAMPVFAGNGDGTFRQRSNTYINSPAYPLQFQGIAAGDINGDARPDVLIAETVQHATYIFHNNCPSTDTAVLVSSSNNPEIFGEPVTLTATVYPRLNATPTGTITFREGTTILGTASLSGSPRAKASIVITPSLGVHSYTATYSGDASYATRTSNVFTQSIKRRPFGTPFAFTATGSAGGGVAMSWVGSFDVQYYEVSKMTNGTWSILGTTTAESFGDVLTGGSGAFYRVRAFGSTAISGHTTADGATALPMAKAIAPGATIEAGDVTELRLATNALRSAAGLSAATFTDAFLGAVFVKALHVTELRTSILPALAAASMPTPSWTHAVAPGVTIRAQDLLELRSLAR